MLLVVVCCPLSLYGYRVFTGTWSGLWRILHRAAAGAGLLFVASAFLAWAAGDRAALARAVPLAALGVAVVVSWRVHVTRAGRKRRKPRGGRVGQAGG